MENSFGERLKHAWNAFMNKDPTPLTYQETGVSSYFRPDKLRLVGRNERSIINSIYNRIAADIAAIRIEHVRLDDNGRYLESINSGLNNCLTLEANKDQTSRAFLQDVVMSMFDEGSVAIVPIETNLNIYESASFDILSMRTGKIVEWMPDHVKVTVYNDTRGAKEDLVLPKKSIGIIENPFYSIMNEPNSVFQRLVRKLSLLDAVDEQSSSGKLDLIIQLPYQIKTQTRQDLADKRKQEIERQLTDSKYGIAYVDSTEKITQLNRPLENNLMNQIEYLTRMLYSQLGIDQTILDGTAKDETMLNYINRIVEPIISSIVDEMKRKFLTKTARSQKQSIMFFRDPFKLVPVSKVADIADKFTRNEIMSSNELRQIVGMKPSKDPAADELRNKNLNQSNEELQSKYGQQEYDEYGYEEDYPYEEY